MSTKLQSLIEEKSTELVNQSFSNPSKEDKLLVLLAMTIGAKIALNEYNSLNMTTVIQTETFGKTDIKPTDA